jgi:hypothetical protein
MSWQSALACWFLRRRFLPEARLALDHAADFVRRVTPARDSTQRSSAMSIV